MLNFIFSHTPFLYLIQSVWRDEAFSYFMAKPNITELIINTANDFNPPLYYLLLHFWLKIGPKEDVFIRLLSFLPHIASVYFAYKLATSLFSKKLATFMTLFTMFNPMLLYYAFEMRMYSFYAAFTFASLYFFYLKKWKWYTIVTILGLYTHSFFPLILVSYVGYFFITGTATKKNLFLVFKPFLFYLPWLPIIALQFTKSANSWMFPVDLQLVKSVLGNLFTNYEGTPGSWWDKTAILSGIIILFIIWGFKGKKKLAVLASLPIFLSLTFILGYSIIRRPIYVNRYLIFVTVYEIVAVSLGIAAIRQKFLRWSATIGWLIFIVVFNIIVSPYHKKTDFKTTFNKINKLATLNDFVYAKTPIGFLESVYYYQYHDKVFIYNPNNISIPNYIGTTVTFPNASKTDLPPFGRTFLVADDASFEIITKEGKI